MRTSLRTTILGLVVLVSASASAADPIRTFVMGDGRVRLWLKGAPTLTASPQGGWVISPAGKEKDKTWLARLKKLQAGDGSPWQTLLDGVTQDQPPSGVVILPARATLSLEPWKDGTVVARADNTKGNQLEAKFLRSGAEWSSDNAAKLLGFLSTATGCDSSVLGAAMAQSSGAHVPESGFTWSPFLSAQLQKPNPVLLEVKGAPSVIDVRVVAPSEPTPPATTTGNTKPAPKTTPEKKTDDSAPFPWLPVLLSSLVGLGIGFAVRPFVLAFGPKGPTKKEMEMVTERLSKSEEMLRKAKSDLDQTKRASQQYRTEQGAWEKDKGETLKVLADERAAHQQIRTQAEGLAVALRQSQGDHQRERAELGRQIQSLQAISQRAKVYSELQREVGEAFNYIQSEIGRPEVAAAVGYLLNYSCAQLMEVANKPNAVLERAMLANIGRIASSSSATPHAKKLAATAQRLSEALGSGAIPESKQPHAHARHFDEVLRLLRHQRGLELSPFYFGVDAAGAAHAVYV